MKKTRTYVFLLLMISVLIVFKTNLSWGSTNIYGPKQFVRGAGKPIVVTESFSAPSTTAHYKLTVLNGDNGQNRVSSATLAINGTEILREKDLNQQVDKIERWIVLKTSNDISVQLKSAPGSFMSVQIECLDCLDITILSPSDGAAVNQPVILVKGSILAASEDIGVSVNGFPAEVNGANWVVVIPMRNEGSNQIKAKVVDINGNSVEKLINVTVLATWDAMGLEVVPESGIAPLWVSFRLFDNLNPPPTLYKIDFEGDGIFDAVASTVEDLYNIYFEQGFYFPVVETTDIQGNTYRATAFVNVLDKDKMDAQLRERWNALKASLRIQDIEGAISNFVSDSQDVYKRLFLRLKPVLSNIVNELNTTQINMISVEGNTARYEILVTRGGNTFSFQLQFMKDSDGIWKIWRY